VKCTRAARDTLHHEPRVLINQNRHTNQESTNAGKNVEFRNP
jgi:hypothetical protein